MHKLYELKDMLCEELESYGSKGKVDASSLEVIDKLAHAIKNIDKIIECKENSDYSGDMGRRYYSRRGNYSEGMDYSNRNRDSMGRYSRTSSLVDELRDIMNSTQDMKTRQKIERFIGEME